VSNKKIEDLKAKRESPEGKLDKNGQHYYGLKEQISVDATYGFVLATVLSKASVHETNYLAYSTIYSQQAKQKLAVVSGDKRAHDMPNRSFSAINNFKDGLMRKSETKAKLTELEMDRKQEISQARSIVEQYFGLSHLHDNGQPDSQREPKII
jgi:tRNA-binding EMAP/Myf-like protein